MMSKKKMTYMVDVPCPFNIRHGSDTFAQTQNNNKKKKRYKSAPRNFELC